MLCHSELLFYNKTQKCYVDHIEEGLVKFDITFVFKCDGPITMKYVLQKGLMAFYGKLICKLNYLSIQKLITSTSKQIKFAYY